MSRYSASKMFLFNMRGWHPFLHNCKWTLLLVDWLEIAASSDNSMTLHSMLIVIRFFHVIKGDFYRIRICWNSWEGLYSVPLASLSGKWMVFKSSGRPLPNKNNVFPQRIGEAEASMENDSSNFHMSNSAIQATFIPYLPGTEGKQGTPSSPTQDALTFNK